jgi:helix-turn-helix protein
MPETNPTTSPAEANRALIEQILQLMNLSSMEEDEKNMWTVMLPSLEKAELEKFKGILEKEITKMTDIYLDTQKNQ